MNRHYSSVKKYNENLFELPLSNIIQGNLDPILGKILKLKILCHTFSRITAHATHVLNKIEPNLYYKITCNCKVIVLTITYTSGA